MRRTLGLLVMSALLPLTLAGGAGAVLTLRAQRLDLERQARDLAGFTATILSRELAANQRSVQMIAQSPAFDGELEEARFRLLAGRLVADEPLWRTLSVASPDGRRILDAPRAIGGQAGGPVVDRVSLEQAVRTGRPVVGTVSPGPRGRAAFAVRAPVVRDGRVRFVVSAVADAAVLQRLVLLDRAPPGWRVQVADGRGVIVADSARPQAAGRDVIPLAVLRPRQALDAAGAPAGMVQLVTEVPSAGWRVRVLAPAAQWQGPEQLALLVGLVAGAVGLALAAAAVRRLLAEVRRERQAEAASAEARRLEALGHMTGGVAHDFNNLLTPILGGLDLLQKRLPRDPRTDRLLEGALQSAERARALVLRLLSFARQEPLEARPVNVADLLQGLVDLLERSAGPDVEVTLELAPEDLWAEVDPSQLELAILNLAVNARDAMPDGGRLRIQADAHEGRPRPALKPGRYVRIAVIDSGTGMDAQTLKRAVDPFFTTKPLGRGTGLGLSMAHALAVQSGGALTLSSAPGEGTCAELWLRRIGPRPVARGPEAAPVGERLGRILLVDDDDLVRRATADMLRDHGHEVVEAASGPEALRVLEGQDVDLVVTDFAMPGQTGGELIDVLREARRGLPVLLITGYAADAEVPPDVPRLAKPFRRTELLARISRLLEPPP